MEFVPLTGDREEEVFVLTLLAQVAAIGRALGLEDLLDTLFSHEDQVAAAHPPDAIPFAVGLAREVLVELAARCSVDCERPVRGRVDLDPCAFDGLAVELGAFVLGLFAGEPLQKLPGGFPNSLHELSTTTPVTTTALLTTMLSHRLPPLG